MASTVYQYERTKLNPECYYDLDDYKAVAPTRPNLTEEIKDNFPDKTFKIQMTASNCYITMSDSLTDVEETILDTIIQDIKDDITANGLTG